MKRLTDILLLPLSIVTLIGCSKNNNQSLDGEYHWLSSERNELAFTIKSDEGPIKNGEVDSFNINKKNTIELTGQNIVSRTESYFFKEGVFSVSINRIENDYYLKGSSAYRKALREFGYK